MLACWTPLEQGRTFVEGEEKKPVRVMVVKLSVRGSLWTWMQKAFETCFAMYFLVQLDTISTDSASLFLWTLADTKG